MLSRPMLAPIRSLRTAPSRSVIACETTWSPLAALGWTVTRYRSIAVRSDVSGQVRTTEGVGNASA